MRRIWPEEFNAIISGAEEVTLEAPAEVGEAPLRRQALKARITMEDYERIWPLAEMRFRLGEKDGKAITLITTNPHYHAWHPRTAVASMPCRRAVGTTRPIISSCTSCSMT
ncbi:hypothetical protein RCCGEPOP_00735 [Rhizobium sp. Pop5]|nr:hypothetical protein RCCGEPOP_00735 [Rhizobium sp. Pop5]